MKPSFTSRTNLTTLTILAILFVGDAALAVGLNESPVVQRPSFGIVVYHVAVITALAFGGVIAATSGRWVWAAFGLLGGFAVFFQALEAQLITRQYWTGLVFGEFFVWSMGHIMLFWAIALSAYVSSDQGWSRRLKIPLYLLAFATAAGWFWGFFIQPEHVYTIFNVSNIATMIAFIVPLSSMVVYEAGKQKWLVYMAISLPLLTVGIYTLLAFGLAAIEFDRFVLNRATLGAVIAFGCLALTFRVFRLRSDREETLQKALELAEKEATTNKALLEAERNYARTREIATAQRRRFAEASHDIKQPLASLRANLDSFAQDQPDEVRTQLKTAFDYLDELATRYGTETTGMMSHGSRIEKENETIPVQLLLQMLERMFRNEAEAKGLTFQLTIIETDIQGDPLVLMRVLSNLLSNAVEHTKSGTISLSAHEDQGRVIFEVFNSGDEISDAMFEAGAKGEGSDGRGLGLTIVKRLATDAGFEFEFESTAGEGNRFLIGV